MASPLLQAPLRRSARRLAHRACSGLAAAGAPLDLRSDTVTRPCSAMRAAMASAVVGDDVYGEDPTVRALEAAGATLLGKEAAVFLPSGTMANLAAIHAHCTARGSELIVGSKSHIFNWEAGAPSSLLGVPMRPVATQPDGDLSVSEVEQALQRWGGDDLHCCVPTLVAFENTAADVGGKAISSSSSAALRAACDAHGGGRVSLHLDGARLLNASVATGEAPAVLAAPAHSATLCLSKGLGSPAGSLLCGSASVIARARQARKWLGGGMRQSGVLAAAALVALERDWQVRLARDHAAATAISTGLTNLAESGMPIEVLFGGAATNMVFFRVLPAGQGGETAAATAAFVEALAERGVLAGETYDTGILRLVTHSDVCGCSDAEAEACVSRILAAFEAALSALSANTGK